MSNRLDDERQPQKNTAGLGWNITVSNYYLCHQKQMKEETGVQVGINMEYPIICQSTLKGKYKLPSIYCYINI